MKRFVTLALVSALVLGASSIVYANVCAFDAVPAATLLFPFVNLDYNSPVAGSSTTFSITNVSAEAQIVHITVWSDFSSSVLDFNILLTGYDVISMNIRDILIGGQLPVTRNEPHAGNGAGLFEGVEVNGPVSAPNAPLNGAWLDPGLDAPLATSTLAAGRCDSTSAAYPGLYVTPIPIGFLNLFKDYLQVSQIVDRLHSDDCTYPGYDNPYDLAPVPFWVSRTTADPTNMYITADVAEDCNKTFPDSPGYFLNNVRDDNVLIGDVFWTNTEERFSEAGNAVHIEADVNLDQVATISQNSGLPISFYHRYASVNDGISDNREPLPTAWAFRYLGYGVPNIGTDVRVWKGSTEWNKTIDLDRVGDIFSPSSLVATNCNAYTYYAWDEDEMVTTVTQVPWSGGGSTGSVIPNLIPLETQEVPIEQFDAPGAFGWMLFVWPASNYPSDAVLFNNNLWDYFQTWMGVKYNAADQWSAAMDAAVMANYNCFSDQILPNLGVNYDYVDGFGYVTSPAVVLP